MSLTSNPIPHAKPTIQSWGWLQKSSCGPPAKETSGTHQQPQGHTPIPISGFRHLNRNSSLYDAYELHNVARNSIALYRLNSLVHFSS
ncbi:hypothetical protein ACLOJK_015427 [Asimina triloba]